MNCIPLCCDNDSCAAALCPPQLLRILDIPHRGATRTLAQDSDSATAAELTCPMAAWHDLHQRARSKMVPSAALVEVQQRVSHHNYQYVTPVKPCLHDPMMIYMGHALQAILPFPVYRNPAAQFGFDGAVTARTGLGHATSSRQQTQPPRWNHS